MMFHRLAATSLVVLLLTVSPAVYAGDPAAGASDADRDVTTLAARIDQLIAAGWAGKDVQPAARADDAEFYRRVHLDLAGRIPDVTAIRDFLDDERADKRRIWVEELLRQPSYAEHFANIWRAVLLANTTNQQVAFQVPSLEGWLLKRFKQNVPYDRLVRELLSTSAGVGPGRFAVPDPNGDSAAVYFQANENKAENLAGSTSRIFLGVKLECAQCHDHPFDKWTRAQFWQYAAFFDRLGQPGGGRGIKIPGTDQSVSARFLDGTDPNWQTGTNARANLVDWLTAANNPFFARAAVNRMWAYFFGIGLVEPADGPGNPAPASHAELLDELARQFVAHRFDNKFLIRAIVASDAYQRTSAVSQSSQQDQRLFARMALRGMTPEQLFDSLATATEYQPEAGPGPQPFFGPNNATPRGEFLAKFSAQDVRTEHQTSILQALYLMNNKFVAARTSLDHNRSLHTIATARTSTARRIESLYLLALSRRPRPDESARLIKYVEEGGPSRDSRKALTDVFWALLNSSEFILNH
jgi:hypothetical protein